MKPRSAWALLGAYALYAVLAIAPAVVAVAVDWQVYTATRAQCVSLSFAGVIAVVMVLLQATGHAPKKVRRVVWYTVVAVCLWMLKPIVQSLALLATCMAGGELAATLAAAPIIAHVKRNREDGRLSSVVSGAIHEAEGRV